MTANLSYTVSTFSKTPSTSGPDIRNSTGAFAAGANGRASTVTVAAGKFSSTKDSILPCSSLYIKAFEVVWANT